MTYTITMQFCPYDKPDEPSDITFQSDNPKLFATAVLEAFPHLGYFVQILGDTPEAIEAIAEEFFHLNPPTLDEVRWVVVNAPDGLEDVLRYSGAWEDAVLRAIRDNPFYEDSSGGGHRS